MGGAAKPEQGRTKTALWIALLGGISVSVQACGGDCTDMPCNAGAEVIFSDALDASSTYVVEIVADGEATSCEATPDGSHDCPGLSFLVTGNESTVTDTGTSLVKGGWAGLLVAGSPRNLRVKVRQADTVVGSAESTLEYEGVEINGSGCGECRVATMSLSVSS